VTDTILCRKRKIRERARAVARASKDLAFDENGEPFLTRVTSPVHLEIMAIILQNEKERGIEHNIFQVDSETERSINDQVEEAMSMLSYLGLSFI